MTDEINKLRDEMALKHAGSDSFKDIKSHSYLEGFDAAFSFQEDKIKKLRTALEFYANRENWDDDKFCPTVWNDGNIDIGKVARQALKNELHKTEELG